MTITLATPEIAGRKATLQLSTRIALKAKQGAPTYYTPQAAGFILLLANFRTRRCRMVGATRHGVMNLKA